MSDPIQEGRYRRRARRNAIKDKKCSRTATMNEAMTIAAGGGDLETAAEVPFSSVTIDREPVPPKTKTKAPAHPHHLPSHGAE